MLLLCISRHRYLSEHICTLFAAPEFQTVSAVGFDDGLEMARQRRPDVVVCDYDLLATMPLRKWEEDKIAAGVPVLAVSMTRRPEEAHLLNINGIAGFLYLPTIEPEQAHAVVRAAAAGRIRPPADLFNWQPPNEPHRAEPR
jgi:DNA-binding NarL/FixJ family response regulator